jgi:hypothetical protein
MHFAQADEVESVKYYLPTENDQRICVLLPSNKP